ncbi:MAG: hypothetical protein HY447_00970 [Candidatus Omnitrophica bacterium]|nr:hypothetical protein [Candidatus Omnitrophota bacterium]
MKKIVFLAVCLLFLPLTYLIAEDESAQPEDQEDQQEDQIEETEEESASEDEDSPVMGVAKGVKQVAYDGPKDFAQETIEETPKKPIVGIVEGVNKGTQKLLDHTVKGAYKVATLGTSELESYKIEEPEKGSDEPTKIKISLPGT